MKHERSVRVRPVSVSSDVCRVSSPADTPPAQEDDGMRQATVGIGSLSSTQMARPVPGSLTGSVSDVHDSVQTKMVAKEKITKEESAFILPLERPIAYKLIRGARVLVFAEREEASGRQEPTPSAASSAPPHRGETQGSGQPTVPQRYTTRNPQGCGHAGHDRQTDEEMKALTSQRVTPSMDASDSAWLQCCECGTLVDPRGDETYLTCMETDARGSVCGHVVCFQCCANLAADQGQTISKCGCHVESDSGFHMAGNSPHAEEPQTAQHRQAPPNDPHVELMKALVENQTQLTRLMGTKSTSEGAVGRRTLLKTTHVLDFPKGSTEALENLDAWLQEFDRVVQHVSSGQGLVAQDRITHLLAAWPRETLVGENMRLDQQTKEYRRLEAAGDMESCWRLLLKTLRGYTVPPAVARRKAQSYWSALAWPADNTLASFHTLLRRALMACERNNIPKDDHEVVMRYLELVPSACALHLEDPLRVPADGWKLEGLMRAAEEYFELRKVYSGDGSEGGLQRLAGRQRRQDSGAGDITQRATWANDKKMLQTPLHANWKSPADALSRVDHVPGSCGSCGGTGHGRNKCPNVNSAKDNPWQKKSESAKSRPCAICQGVGHWAMHHTEEKEKQLSQREPQQRQQAAPDCRFWIVGKCGKGNACAFSHDPKKKGTPVEKDCKFWLQGNCPNNPCRYKHDPQKRNTKTQEKGKGKGKGDGTKACNGWLRGKCKFGDKCKYEHDPKLKGTQTRAVTVEEDQEQQTGEGQTRRLREEADESPPFVFTRPSRIKNSEEIVEGCVNTRRMEQDEEVFDLAKYRAQFPVVPRPPKGYCHSSSMRPLGLSELPVRVIWDGGAEGTSISDSCMSRILRAQAGKPVPECALKAMARMSAPQKFYGFTNDNSKTVEFIAELTLCTPDDNMPLPPLTVRVVPGQHDDVLVAAPDLDLLGFDLYSDSRVFLLKRAGLAVLRETSAPDITQSQLTTDDQTRSVLRTVTSYNLEAFAITEVEVARTNRMRPVLAETLGWVKARNKSGLTVELVEGPVEDSDVDTLRILVRNVTSDALELPADTEIGEETSAIEEHLLLAEALEEEALGSEASPEEPVTSNMNDRDPRARVSLSGDQRSAGTSLTTTLTTRTWMMRWVVLLLALLSRIPSVPSDGPMVEDTSTRFRTTKLGKADDYTFTEARSEEYKEALSDALEKQRTERYGHLSDTQYMKLRAVVLEFSECIAIEGLQPTIVKGMEFDIDLEPGAQPVRHQLPKLSPAQVKKEQYHIEKEERLGHLRKPTDEQKGPWSTKIHVVGKKDDDMGRLICDFRPINRVTVKRPTPIGDVYTKARRLAEKRWKSTLDALHGFNQMGATERAKRLLQIITHKGLRQWTIMPFGVTNGPPYFQEYMLWLFGDDVANGHDSLLDSSMADLDAYLDIFIDDLQLGTGSVTESKEDYGEDSFDQHLSALRRVLQRARSKDLRFKLTKCYFCQWSVECLGMTVGQGVIRADPKKTKAITVWPRPSRLEDVERFLATTVFIRQHLSPRYSEVSKPLRDCLTELQQRRRDGKRTMKAKYHPHSENEGGNSWPTFWDAACEEAFKQLKNMAANAVELHTPDLDGAMSGRNPLHLWPDACAYGIGAGLFQSAPQEQSKVDTAYDVLGITKVDDKGGN